MPALVCAAAASLIMLCFTSTAVRDENAAAVLAHGCEIVTPLEQAEQSPAGGRASSAVS